MTLNPFSPTQLHILSSLTLLIFTLKGGGYQRLRANLYGSLLYYLQIAQKPDEPDTLQSGITQTSTQKVTKPLHVGFYFKWTVHRTVADLLLNTLRLTFSRESNVGAAHSPRRWFLQTAEREPGYN